MASGLVDVIVITLKEVVAVLIVLISLLLVSLLLINVYYKLYLGSGTAPFLLLHVTAAILLSHVELV